MSATLSIIDVTIIVVVGAALGAGLGFLAARVRQTRSQVELDQLRQTLDSVRSELADSQALLAEARDANHQQALTQSRLEEQLSGAQAEKLRLEADLQARRTELDELDKARRAVEDTRHAAETQLEAARTQIRGLQERLEDVAQRLADEQSAGKQLRDEHQRLLREHTQLKTSLERREEHFKEQMAQLSDTRQSLTKEFENLANKIFEEKGKTFTHTSQASIDHLLKPFREQIDGFQKRINEVHDASLKGSSQLNAEIRRVLEVGLKMSQDASNLTSALKGDSQQRGAWGEAQLRRTLEMSGLVEEDHFEAQKSFKDASGRTRQTDYLIKLPDGKHIVIDSKVSLVAYDRVVSAETPEEAQLAMAEHVKAVRRHIDDLASKDYTNLIGVQSPNFVLMFMPIEPAYIEALKSSRDLFEYGYKKNIVLVSHTTLIPILRTVSNLWMIERSNAEARQISESAGDIFNNVCLVAERLKKLGGTLETATRHYNDTVTSLAGKQGLHGKVERFSQLSSRVTKSLPSLEPTHADVQTERLALIVETLDESDPDIDVEGAVETRENDASLSSSVERQLPEPGATQGVAEANKKNLANGGKTDTGLALEIAAETHREPATEADLEEK